MDIDYARQFGKYRPVQEFLGTETLQVLAAPEQVESYIIEAGPERRREGLDGCTILVEAPLLNEEQVRRLTEAILTPEAHYNGSPIFRRSPSVPDFAFRLWRGKRVLDVLVDLRNPGWEFYCGTERYENWNWVGYDMRRLAKELFPRFASANSRFLWRQEAMKALTMKKNAARKEKTARGG